MPFFAAIWFEKKNKTKLLVEVFETGCTGSSGKKRPNMVLDMCLFSLMDDGKNLCKIKCQQMKKIQKSCQKLQNFDYDNIFGVKFWFQFQIY